MIRFRLSRLLALVSLCVLSMDARAQTGAGTIRGTVTSAETHAPIAHARVAVENIDRVAISDERGAYVLRDVPVGSHTLVVTALGREPLRQPATVAAGATVTQDLALARGSLLLSSVVVSATRTATEASEVASTVNVLTPELIETSPARESQDLLREIPAVELPRTSSLVGGTAQIVSIRGVDEGRTVVLFDGIPVSDAWGEWIDWGRVPKNMLDRVEVIEGGTSSLYGNGAMGGLISFFSRPMAPNTARVVLDAGSRDAKHGFVAMGLPIAGALTANVSGDYLEGGGYTLLDPAVRGLIDLPSEIVQRNGYLRLLYEPSSRLSAFITGHLFGDSRYTGTPLSRQSREQQSADVGVNYDLGTRGLFSFRGWNGVQTERQRSAGIRGNSATCTPSATTARQCEDSSVNARIPSHDWGASLQWTKRNLPFIQSFSVGGDYRHMQGNFDEVDWNTTCPGANCGVFLRRIISGGDQALSGAFVQAIANPFAPLRIELSARVDRWDNKNGLAIDSAATSTTQTVLRYGDSSKVAFSPRLGVRYAVLRNLALHGAVYKAFRAPNLAELYRKQINANASQITLPNPYLKAENALGREVGLSFQPLDWAQIKGTWYVAEYTDFNVPVTLAAAQRPPECGTAATCRQRLPVNKSRSEGGELYVALRPVEPLFVSVGVNYDDARVVDGPAGTVVGAHINRVPSPKQTVRATWTSRLLGSYTGIWRHEGHTTTLQGAWLDPMEVLDLEAQRELVPGIRAHVSLENVQNRRYQVNVSGNPPNQLYSFGMPRTLRVGIEAFRY